MMHFSACSSDCALIELYRKLGRGLSQDIAARRQVLDVATDRRGLLAGFLVMSFNMINGCS